MPLTPGPYTEEHLRIAREEKRPLVNITVNYLPIVGEDDPVKGSTVLWQRFGVLSEAEENLLKALTIKVSDEREAEAL